MTQKNLHTFHIPVLGISFSIDTPLKVARYGISSVVSIVDDEIIEDLRNYYCHKNNIEYIPIKKHDNDSRAKRITSYLNLLKQLVEEQITHLKTLDFKEGSDLNKYFDLLPNLSALKIEYLKMLEEKDSDKQLLLQKKLINSIVAGDIDVNIMAKVDNPGLSKSGNQLPDEFSEALSALRGFANSNLCSSVVISAGYNPRLFNYLSNFQAFYPNSQQNLEKKIILKVSDFRSAMTQGKVLAKKGLWVSEYRIESGLNCGGHAFATQGHLMGPILEEFKINKKSLQMELFKICNTYLSENNKNVFNQIPEQRITAQGGIGTAEEQDFLISYYQLDGTGWGSPFLLVPEATNVDPETLNKLGNAKKEDFYLSDASPLGVPFHNLRNTSSEIQINERVSKNRPGSPCYKKYLSSNTEFTENIICTASRQYQNLKIKQLRSLNLSEDELQKRITKVEEKDCLCEGLSSSVRINNNMNIPHNIKAVTICPGPNTAFFSGIYTLKNMVNHIYGIEKINYKLERPHMFVNELKLYIDYLKKKLSDCWDSMDEKQEKFYTKFKENLQSGIDYYRNNQQLVLNNSKATLDLLANELQLLDVKKIKIVTT
ncbi:MAG: hypothetical protein IT238_05915 [Bacteroidia bacterium]|nr:hypothetical protein [Bacteroidia bacterium]MCZ2248100.1 hypothetical protein [Bacteroidia bacterium]